VLLSHQAFSNGRGSEIVCFTLDIFAKRVVGRTMGDLTRDMGTTWRHMVNDSQYRWIGPEKSVTHLAVAGVLNAVWDLWGKILAKPVWRIVADMTPEELVKCVDFRYITDAITPEEALKLLKTTQIGKEDRIAEALKNEAVPVRFFWTEIWAEASNRDISRPIRHRRAGLRSQVTKWSKFCTTLSLKGSPCSSSK
jgi:hypothetical protein